MADFVITGLADERERQLVIDVATSVKRLLMEWLMAEITKTVFCRLAVYGAQTELVLSEQDQKLFGRESISVDAKFTMENGAVVVKITTNNGFVLDVTFGKQNSGGLPQMSLEMPWLFGRTVTVVTSNIHRSQHYPDVVLAV